MSEPAEPWGRQHLLVPAAHGAWSAAFCALGVWLLDALRVAAYRPEGPASRWVAGLGAALFVSVTTAALAGAVLGPFVAPGATRARAHLAREWSLLRGGEPRVRRALSSTLVTLLVVAAVGLAVAYPTVMAAQVVFARPESVAIVLALSHLLLGALLVGLWAMLHPVLVKGFERLEAVPFAGRLFQVAWGVPLALALAGALAVAVLVTAYRPEVMALPWGQAFPFLGVPLGLVGAEVLLGARSRKGTRGTRGTWISRGALAALGALVAVGGGTALRLQPTSTTARRVGFEEAASGRLGYAAWSAALDFDHDGQINLFGGGDCAPFDPRRHIGALDIPGNGIDEDCDGADLTRDAIRPRARIEAGQNRLPLRPTIVLVTVDALSAGQVGALGGDASRTPHLDELAGRSALFTRCFAQGPSTRLSFPAIFTSRYDSQLVRAPGVKPPFSLAGSERQLQDVLDENGYETAAVIPHAYFSRVKWPSVTHGFQTVDESAVAAGKHNATAVTDAAIQILRAPRDKPLYLWVHYFDAHGPNQKIAGVHYARENEEGFYEAEVSSIDVEIGRLAAELDARAEPPYLIVSADHGTVFHSAGPPRHGHYGYDLFTSTLHVPLIVHGPGIAPRRVTALASTMDIEPTLLDMLRITDKAELEGWSMVRELMGAAADPQRVIFHEFYLPERSIRGDEPLEMVSARNERWNLILNRVRGSYALYDWDDDYDEGKDQYENRARDPEVRKLRSLLGAFDEQFDKRPASATLPPPVHDEP